MSEGQKGASGSSKEWSQAEGRVSGGDSGHCAATGTVAVVYVAGGGGIAGHTPQLRVLETCGFFWSLRFPLFTTSFRHHFHLLSQTEPLYSYPIDSKVFRLLALAAKLLRVPIYWCLGSLEIER